MKNNTSCCNEFDKHNELIVEFKPCEIAKQFDVNINMGDGTYPSPTPSPSCGSCDTNYCNDDSLLLLVVLIILYFNSKC